MNKNVHSLKMHFLSINDAISMGKEKNMKGKLTSLLVCTFNAFAGIE